MTKNKSKAKGDRLVPEAASWQAALLVCKVCQKRSSGPKRVKTKAIVGEAERLLRSAKPRPRVVMTSCLGLCPKAAIAVARVGGGATGGARIVAIDSLRQLEQVLPLLVESSVNLDATSATFPTMPISPALVLTDGLDSGERMAAVAPKLPAIRR